jgi:hypothetical protein
MPDVVVRAGMASSTVDGEEEDIDDELEEERRRKARRRVLGDSSEREAIWNVCAFWWCMFTGVVSARRVRRRRERSRPVSDEKVRERRSAWGRPSMSMCAAVRAGGDADVGRASALFEKARRRIAGDGITGACSCERGLVWFSCKGLGGDVTEAEDGGEGG